MAKQKRKVSVQHKRMRKNAKIINIASGIGIFVFLCGIALLIYIATR